MIRIDSEQQLDHELTQPSEADIAFAHRLRGDCMVLGAGGKMGPTLARRLQLALRAADRNSRVIAVSRFQSADAERELTDAGVETISCDLLDPDSVRELPRSKTSSSLRAGSLAPPGILR